MFPYLLSGTLTDRDMQHGIDYGVVGGDPAELMRICIENGTFTVAFLREGLLKVRHVIYQSSIRDSAQHIPLTVPWLA